MDRESQQSGEMHRQSNQSLEQAAISATPVSSPSKEQPEVKPARRPGRPPLRIKSKNKHADKQNDNDNDNDDDFEASRYKIKEKPSIVKEERENSMDGFLRIIDYLKKIDCDEASLHNKMNPYNLLTPTCFWYMLSAEYFSFDFFNSRFPHETALEILRKAQRTQIVLPLRVIKPQRPQEEIEFVTPELHEKSIPITEKLMSLICAPSNSSAEVVEKSAIQTSVTQDNEFRSSTRAIVFNWVKKKLSSSEKWNYGIKNKLEAAQTLPKKKFTSKMLELKQEVKHEQLDVAPEIFYRQKKAQKSPSQNKGGVQPNKNGTHHKKAQQKTKNKPKKQAEDQIYDESQSEKQGKNEEVALQEQMEADEGVASNPNTQRQNQMVDEGIQMADHHDSQKEPNEKCADDSQDEDLSRIEDIVSFEKIYTEDDLLLESIMNLPLDFIISILKSSIEPIRLPEIVRPFMPIPRSDPLQLVYQTHVQEEVFLDYMRDRQEKMFMDKTCHSETALEEKEREIQTEDAKCQVCTDGDYTEDNLIVFCSMCNISLHQRCVGLAKVPADNWICEVCASFGPAGINVPCPLCRVKGGALKRTAIHINTPLFKDTNPEYNEYGKRCPNYKHKQEYVNPNKDNKNEEEPYYDYFNKATYPTDQPVCHFVWVHYVCAIWVPECYFEEKNGMINIKGIENIDKKRFKERCLICKETKAGACVKCDNQNCSKYYHPECARRRKIYMEQLNLDKLKYLIFCEAHEPLKVKRKIEVKKKKQRDEIVKFCRGIEKYVETYKIANLPFKLMKLNSSSQDLARLEKREKTPQGEQKICLKLEKNSDEEFIKAVIDSLIRQNQILVNLSVLGMGRYKVDEVVKPSKRDMRKSLTRVDQFWKNFKNIETPDANLKRFNNIMRENIYLREKIDNFISFGHNNETKFDDKKISRNGGRRRRQKVETVIQQQGAIFCVCRRPYQGEQDMFECEVCNQWYHYQCIGFIGSEKDAQDLVFHCMKCLKFQSPENKKQLLQKCSKLFSQDSLFLNYRPPTPSLQSEDEEVAVNNIKAEQPRTSKVCPEVQISNNEGPKKMNGHFTGYRHWEIEDENINFEKPFIVSNQIEYQAYSNNQGSDIDQEGRQDGQDQRGQERPEDNKENGAAQFNHQGKETKQLHNDNSEISQEKQGKTQKVEQMQACCQNAKENQSKNINSEAEELRFFPKNQVDKLRDTILEQDNVYGPKNDSQ